MTVPTLTFAPRDRRAIRVGVVIIAALVVGGRGFPAWRRWEQASLARASVASLDLGRKQAALVDQRAVHDSLVARSTRLAALRSTWLDGDTPAAAGAALAAAISSVGERTGVTIGALDIRVDSGASQAFVPVRIHATAVGDIQGLGSFVAGLEGGALALTIRALSIDAADGAAPPNRAEVLNAELTVESPWRRGAMETSP